MGKVVDQQHLLRYFFIVTDKYKHFEISENDNNKRIDGVIRKFLPNLPLKAIFKAIRSGDIRVNNKKVKQNYRLTILDTLYIYKPLLSHTKNEITKTSKLESKRVIFENDNLLIYNKERGELVHGKKDSLDKKVKYYLKDKVKESLSFSPGPLHRLDRNTQGLITFSVSLKGAREFTNFLQNSEIKKIYLTLVEGAHTNREVWEDKISRDEENKKSFKDSSGELAVTTFIPLLTKKGKTLALMDIKSGRTHQIRVQASIHNRPLVGDNKYNSIKSSDPYFLSAISLTFPKKNDILSKRNIYLDIEKQDISTLTKFFTKEELMESEVLIKKELII